MYFSFCCYCLPEDWTFPDSAGRSSSLMLFEVKP
jgi:hypothetical protein